MQPDPVVAATMAALNGKWEEAEALNIKYLQEFPDDVDALNRLTKAYLERAKYKEAKATLAKIKKLDPYNQIAAKNTERMALYGNKKSATHPGIIMVMDFIEEPGKTKTVALTNLGAIRLRKNLNCGQSVVLQTKRRTVQVFDTEDRYLGSLPDDLGHRLNILIKGGNTYEACLKSTNDGLIILIKETSRGKKFRLIPSFPQNPHPLTESQLEAEVAASSTPAANPDDDDDESPPKAIGLHADEESEELT